MIYMKFGEQSVLVIGPGNLRKMKETGPMVSPDQQVVVIFTPDVDWVAEQLQAALPKIDGQAIDNIIAAGKERPEIEQISGSLKEVSLGEPNES